MLVARGKLERRQAIIDIGVQRFAAEAQELSATGTPASIEIQKYRALLDTGAQRTCLTRQTIAQEGLVRHGHKFIKNVHSEATHSLFLVNIGIWGMAGERGINNEPTRSYYAIDRAFEVINIADNLNFDAILGMDVLESFDFRFSNDGDFEIDLA